MNALAPVGLDALARPSAVPERKDPDVLRWRFPEAVAPWTLVGASRAALSTGFCIPEMDWLLDAGVLVHDQRPSHIFVSHTHSDHVHQLPRIKSRRKPPLITLPHLSVPLLEDWFRTSQALTFGAQIDDEELLERSYDLLGVAPGDSLRIARGRVISQVDVVACDHAMDCVGYLFSEIKLRLKDEFAGLPGAQLGALRRQGVELSEEVPRPQLAYLTDTTARVFDRHPEVLQAPVIVTECTFIDDDHREAAERTRHTLWSDLLPVIEAHPQACFVLIHFSQRYRDEELVRFFAERAPDNVIPWLDGALAA